MKITPVKGTCDYLPSETAVRDRMQNTILGVYRAAGFQRVTTPILEDEENLDHSDGGENLSLIFKILKRGDKFDEAYASGDPKQLCDLGLRYDLTLPLCRFCAANRAVLPTPFKVIQLDRVYRAERPQKGRLREFIQCDIDIIGDSSYTAEAELILTTAKALKALGFSGFRVKLNDRSLLRALITGAGFRDEEVDSVCISLDKLDKIGADGVAAELTGKGFDAAAIARLGEITSKPGFSLEDAAKLCPDSPAQNSLRSVMAAVAAVDPDLDLVYDTTLVRGQGYYTGTVFEVEDPRFRGSIAGGGRYDNLIGKFTGSPTPAVGFSIGFERIYSILTEQKTALPALRSRRAVIWEKDFAKAYRLAEVLRSDSDVELFAAPKKLGKLLDRLASDGFSAYVLSDVSDEVRPLREMKA